MHDTEHRDFPGEVCSADPRMRFRRGAMLGCLGFLFLMAAAGISPLEMHQAARRAFLETSSQPEAFGTLATGGFFQPFPREEESRGGGGSEDAAGQTPSGNGVGSGPNVFPTAEGKWCLPGLLDGPCVHEAVFAGCVAGFVEPVVATMGNRAAPILGGFSRAPTNRLPLSASAFAAYIQGQLRELGVSQYVLEPWGGEGDAYRFWCKVPTGESVLVTRYFEAIDRDSAGAVVRVLAEIEAWRRGG